MNYLKYLDLKINFSKKLEHSDTIFNGLNSQDKKIKSYYIQKYFALKNINFHSVLDVGNNNLFSPMLFSKIKKGISYMGFLTNNYDINNIDDFNCLNLGNKFIYTIEPVQNILQNSKEIFDFIQINSYINLLDFEAILKYAIKHHSWIMIGGYYQSCDEYIDIIKGQNKQIFCLENKDLLFKIDSYQVYTINNMLNRLKNKENNIWSTVINQDLLNVDIVPLAEIVSIREYGSTLVRVKIKNNSPYTLSNNYKFPICISYHIYKNNKLLLYEGLVTTFYKPLYPGEEEFYDIFVYFQFMYTDDEYKLRFTLVQENCFWASNIESRFLKIKIQKQDQKKNLKNYFFYNGISYRPKFLNCETINICNNNCKKCRNNLKRTRQTMNMKIFKKLLDDYSEIGGGAISLIPTGGEIFLDKYLYKRILLIRDYKNISDIIIHTNGTKTHLLNNRELKFILDNLSKLEINIFGISQKEYMSYTHKDNYGQLLENLKNISKVIENKSIIYIKFQFTNMHTVEEIEEWLMTYLGAVVPYEYIDPNNNDKAISDDTLSQLPCYYPFLLSHIFVDGKVSLCGSGMYETINKMIIGNINTNSLKEIFSGPNILEFLNSDFSLNCKNCPYYENLLKMNLIYLANNGNYL